MKIFYKTNYFEDFGREYESISESDFKLLNSFFPKIRGNHKILELGCGSCVFGKKIQNNIPDSLLFGLDICLPLLKYSSRPCCQGDASYLPFPDNTFDCILVAAAFHHFPDIIQSLSEAHRCLRPGGVLFSYEPNKFHPQRLIFMTNPLRSIFYKTGDHAISPFWMRRKMKQIGFCNISLEYISLGKDSSSYVARLQSKFTNFIKIRFPSLLIVSAPWFIVIGTKEK